MAYIMRKHLLLAIFFLCITLLLTGCDPVARHKALSTVFDGVPSLPPAEQYCADYAEKKIIQMQDEAANKAAATGAPKGSQHQPYEEKECDNCHDKNKKDGLRAPRAELCFLCHTGFIKGEWVHGPISVADCLACHEPHYSKFPKLLKQENGGLCHTCHKEKRVSDGMHAKVAERNITCVDCHDPHYGKVRFFLK